MWLVLHVMQIHNPVVSIMLWLVGTAAAAVAAFHLLEEPMINAGRAITASLVSKPRLDPVAVGDW
jgi:peptidoglycan/LPS O-acetylase OafA/YrhL